MLRYRQRGNLHGYHTGYLWWGSGFLNLFFYCFYWAVQGVLSRQCPTLIHSNLSSFQGLEALSYCFIPMLGDGNFESGFLQTPSVWVRPAMPGCTPPWPWSQDLILAQLFILSPVPFQQSGYTSDGVHFIDTSVPLGLSQNLHLKWTRLGMFRKL